MIVIKTLEKCISIDGTLVPKNSREVSLISNGALVGNVNTPEAIKLIVNECEIDGEIVTRLDTLIDYLAENLFIDGGVTSEWVTEQIINAQLEGEEIDLSVYLRRAEFTPYKNKVDQLSDILGLKIHLEEVNSVDGVWRVNFPDGKFSKPPFVMAMAVNTDASGTNRANFASLDRNTTATSASGVTKRCTSAGLLAAMEMVTTDCPVKVIAIEV